MNTCPRCNGEYLIECLTCGFVPEPARGHWELLNDGTVRILDEDEK